MASIARAFSVRPKTSSGSKENAFFPNKLTKSNSMRQLGVQISAPVLVSTTNVQTLNTRDVSQKQHTLRKVSFVLQVHHAGDQVKARTSRQIKVCLSISRYLSFVRTEHNIMNVFTCQAHPRW